MCRLIVLFVLAIAPPGPTEPEVARLIAKELAGARTEVVLSDGSRADVLTPTHAYEVDWARKWSEGIGQALLYAELTGLEPGLILIVRDRLAESRYVLRARIACKRAGVQPRVWILGKGWSE